MTDWQRRVAVFAQRHGLLHDPTTHTLDLVSEVGEVAKEVLLSTNYGQRTLQFGPQLVDELGDALYSLLALAEVCGVDAASALDAVLGKYKRRLTGRGEPGSK
jgi:NTP pyrophosphatase (non-canonical NTP hydrolase)